MNPSWNLRRQISHLCTRFSCRSRASGWDENNGKSTTIKYLTREENKELHSTVLSFGFLGLNCKFVAKYQALSANHGNELDLCYDLSISPHPKWSRLVYAWPCQLNPPHAITAYFKIYFNIILTSMSRFLKWTLSFSLSNQNCVCISVVPHACDVPPKFNHR